MCNSCNVYIYNIYIYDIKYNMILNIYIYIYIIYVCMCMYTPYKSTFCDSTGDIKPYV